MTSMQHKFGALDLIRAGLQDLDRARTLFDELHNDGIDGDRMRLLLATLEKACDPDIALSNLVDIIKVMQSQGKDFTNIIADENSFVRLITVLGVSDEMGKLMRFRPELVEAAANDACESHLYNHEQRRAHVLKSVGADPNDHTMPTASLPLAEAATALRKTYRKQLAAIMAQDATANDPIEIQPRISTELSDLADAALEGALAIARHEVDGSEHVRFAIIGMGKLGAQELNYVSDVDLIYVVEPADMDTNGMALSRIGTKIATTLQRVCQSVIMGVAEPTLWQIDGGLRPEGKDGPLVRRLESHEAYYEQWAENWEFQALLKARPVAGDTDLGQAYMDMTRPSFGQLPSETTSSMTASRCANVYETYSQPAERSRNQTRQGRLARRRIHRADAPTRARPLRRSIAYQLHTRIPAGLGRRRVRLTQTSQETFMGLPIRTCDGTPPANVGAQTHPPVPRPRQSQRWRS